MRHCRGIAGHCRGRRTQGFKKQSPRHTRFLANWHGDVGEPGRSAFCNRSRATFAIGLTLRTLRTTKRPTLQIAILGASRKARARQPRQRNRAGAWLHAPIMSIPEACMSWTPRRFGQVPSTKPARSHSADPTGIQAKKGWKAPRLGNMAPTAMEACEEAGASSASCCAQHHAAFAWCRASDATAQHNDASFGHVRRGMPSERGCERLRVAVRRDKRSGRSGCLALLRPGEAWQPD